jgi:leucyl-tRNA synthetase
MLENVHEIEKKWQSKWERAKVYEANPSKKKKFFITFPYPYVNLAPHIGHSFSAFRTDCYARFKRMQGYNVLYPQGFHATGEPILGVVERLRKGDSAQIETFKLSGATDADIEDFKASGPERVARFWMARWIEDLKRAGFAIDWRRTFITALTPTYNRFIEWQYNSLKRLGYVAQGTHPVIWCPHCQSPTGDHDRLEGEGESPIEYTLLKFKLADDISAEHRTPIYLVAATLRPETIYGITNIWLNPDAEYVIIMVGNELWLVSAQAVQKLQDQLHDVRDVGHVAAEQLLGKRAVDPISGRSIPILPAHFVEAESATGVVMSVPAHAPYDWIAVKELLDQPEQLERFGVKSDELKPITLATSSDLPDPPAVKISEKLDIKNQKERDKLDQATSIVYKREFHTGVLNDKCGPWAGKKISEVKEGLVSKFKGEGIAASIWEPTGTVVCRCTTRCHVKVLENQWFLRYSDSAWKDRVRKALEKMTIYPESARHNFEATIDWLKDKACARRSGLGTKVPWDPDWIIETLSDSTIYMAFYTIAHVLNENKVKPENLPDAVFDFVFAGKGSAGAAAKTSGLSTPIIRKMRNEFAYWYPVDMRCSAKDLLQHHLTFFIYHHVALFPEAVWPRGISVNGYVNVAGEKMSKSKGNVIPFRELVEKHGSDLVRINIAGSAEGLEDADWRIENVPAYISRLEFLAELAGNLKKAKRAKPAEIDAWLLSNLQGIISETSSAFEQMYFRTGIQHCLFDATNALKWYFKRVGGIKTANKKTLQYALDAVVRMLCPLAPHACEELWSKLGGKGFAVNATWPIANTKLVDKDAENAEELIRKTLADVDAVKKLVAKKGITAKKITLFVALAKMFPMPKQKEVQLKTLHDSHAFISRELECDVEIVDADGSKHEKAFKAKPDKLGILIE